MKEGGKGPSRSKIDGYEVAEQYQIFVLVRKMSLKLPIEPILNCGDGEASRVKKTHKDP